MNGTLAVVIALVMGVIGGIGYGYYAYGGVVKPKSVKRNIPLGTSVNAPTDPMVMWVPGVFGHAVFGMITSLVVFGLYVAPKVFVGSTVGMTWHHVSILLIAALGGSTLVGEWIDSKQWERFTKAVPNAKKKAKAPRAFQALELTGEPTT